MVTSFGGAAEGNEYGNSRRHSHKGTDSKGTFEVTSYAMAGVVEAYSEKSPLGSSLFTDFEWHHDDVIIAYPFLSALLRPCVEVFLRWTQLRASMPSQ